ncbi:MAG: DUF3667 domain-containing protein [Thermoflavifilum sp.]|nr:DUF3667 domain-containing protein [Thermoflavifilum sp.]
MPHTLRNDSTCLNCGHRVEERFCTHCGQENIEPRERFGELVTHFVADLFHYDKEFLLTLRYLLFKPGFLTLEYIKGRRKAYLHPIRMYLFVSLIYFLFVSVIPQRETSHPIIQVNNMQATQPSNKDGWSFPYTSVHQYDSIQQQLPDSLKNPPWVRKLMHRIINIHQTYGDRAPEVIREKFIHHVPQVMFFLLPLFAVILSWHFRNKNDYFSDHVIFSLHFHIFYFLISALEIILQYFLRTDLFVWITWCIAWIYLILALHTVYQNKWWKTILKSISVGLIYIILIGFVMSGLAIWIIWEQ